MSILGLETSSCTLAGYMSDQTCRDVDVALRSQRGLTIELEWASKQGKDLHESHLQSEIEPYWEAAEGNEAFSEEELRRRVARTAFPLVPVYRT